MLYSTATTCAMRNTNDGSGILTKIFSCHGHVVPSSASYWPYIYLYHVLRSGKGYTHFLHGHVSDSYFACLMAAISVFTTTTISKNVLNDTNMVTCRATYLKPL